ncbi:hypothetical protein NLX83_36655 [Allokutzneria sp. A3M-2-11 16]|uniref:hypothetical protein n=1 Tax=Allokutzneria sp. A3M-2-11 16 TaxID=2962043 RepID=UPI0020B843D2|nr:hypothetical protein [Allokutzneria sp. A3M-2-11 16]MCP3804812.1 hypothetical protein [Allokutzneria sp. A3M-2-11 16]
MDAPAITVLSRDFRRRAARTRASRTGESYLAALESLVTEPDEPIAPLTAEERRALRLCGRLHGELADRGWSVYDDTDREEFGGLAGLTVVWLHPPRPGWVGRLQLPSCALIVDAVGQLVVEVELAGVVGGCEPHRVATVRMPASVELRWLRAVLYEVEAKVRGADTLSLRTCPNCQRLR